MGTAAAAAVLAGDASGYLDLFAARGRGPVETDGGLFVACALASIALLLVRRSRPASPQAA